MFHDDLLADEERARFHDAFGKLADAVSASLRLFLWALEEFQRAAYGDGRDLHAVPQFLMLDFADSIDGVAILARSGSARNCSQLLRTALEIQLSIKYMMEHKDNYERRVLAYEYYHLKDRLRWAQRCDPSSEVGKQLRAALAGDQFADMFDSHGIDAAAQARAEEAKMNSARYSEVRTELARMKAGKIKDSNWFSLWDGPKDVRSLAIRLKMGSLYESLYRNYSAVTHGEGAIKRISGTDGEKLHLDALRSPKDLPGMCQNACSLCNSMMVFVVEGLVPHLRDEMRRRYINDVRPGLAFIDSVKGL